MRYCCAAVAASGAASLPLPPDADAGDDDDDDGDGDGGDGEGKAAAPPPLVGALDDPDAPWGAHYAALARDVAARRAARAKDKGA